MNRMLVTRAVILFGLIWGTHPAATQAQWPDRSDELPGLISTRQLLTGTAIALSGFLVATLLYPSPEPALLLTAADFRDGTATERLDGYAGPVAVRSRGMFGKTRAGILRSSGVDRLALEGRSKSTAMPISRVRTVVDLPTAAEMERVGRMRIGFLYAGMAASYAYYATLDEHPLEKDQRTLNRIMAGSFTALSAYTLLHRSGLEKEAEQWVTRAAWRAHPMILVGRNGPTIGVRLRSMH